ncbi:hypothetical protein RvY_03634-2 [Ramazzottius varieornatus]|uniref:Lysosomal dipeptide transporter MFSD1 n=1 Tax=Ramazzottius varieornatus TaxID=947166 RepID=A0A1D1UNS4_RAMVA|nr:hypothetical protein RvY_03634-2 [Ramazzottius varieornatus]
MDTRWWVLVFCCIAVSLPNFFELQLSTLVQRLTGTASACTNGTESCLQFDLMQFNIIVGVYPWSRAVAAILAGILVDQFGSKYVLWGFAAFLFLGPLIFTLGAYAMTTRTAYALMILGRMIFGFGTGGYEVLLHRVKTGWFLYKELALAFSIEILFDRLGTASMFLVLGGLVEVINMRGVLWFTFGLNLIGVAALLLLAHLDRVRTVGLFETESAKRPWWTIWTALGQFDTLYWLLVITLFLYDGTVQTFVANAPNFFAVR